VRAACSSRIDALCVCAAIGQESGAAEPAARGSATGDSTSVACWLLPLQPLPGPSRSWLIRVSRCVSLRAQLVVQVLASFAQAAVDNGSVRYPLVRPVLAPFLRWCLARGCLLRSERAFVLLLP
jgi:hypothetical protein